jgi:hypothetical protein
MNSLRRRLSDWNLENHGPSLAEYVTIIVIFAVIGLLAIALAEDQTRVILSTVSGSI